MTEINHDYDFFVIGGGSGGVRAARIAASLGARVGLAEFRELGGTCVNVGCVPKKMLVYGASYHDDFEHAADYGWHLSAPTFDWPRLIGHKNREIARLNGVYEHLLAQSGVTLHRARARLLDAHTVAVGEERVRARHILIATGCAPHVPELPGGHLAITSDDAFSLRELPRRVIVVGGGYIAVEFASIFHGLGAQVTQLYRGELFLRHFDDDLRRHLRDQLRVKGLDLQFGADIARLDRVDDGCIRATLADGRSLDADRVLYATGRRPHLDNLGLENTGVRVDARGYIEVDAQYRTAEPSIHAVGDVIGRVQLTPVAIAEGMWVARHLFGDVTPQAIDYALIPTAVFSLPNVGTVGLSEQQAREQGHEVKVFESRFRTLKLTLTESREQTYLKLVVEAGSDRVLGCHLIGPDAGEVIQGLAVALTAGATKAQFDATLGIHPTTAEEFVTLRQARDG